MGNHVLSNPDRPPNPTVGTLTPVQACPRMKGISVPLRSAREDPNPDRKGKAKMVTQEGKTYSDFVEEKDACYHKVKASAKVYFSAYASGRLVQCRKKGAANYGKSKKKD